MKVVELVSVQIVAATAVVIFVALAAARSELGANNVAGDDTSLHDFRLQGILAERGSAPTAAEGPGSTLDRTGLIKTFGDEFTDFSWYADGVVGGKPGGGTWRTHFGYAGVQDRGSRTLPSNGEQQIYVDRAFRGTAPAPLGLNPFRIANGTLEITADRTSERIRPYIWNYPYVSGLITTRGTFAQQYGLFEARARIPKGRGLWSCIWLLPARGGWPPELDILEVLGNRTDTLVTTWHSRASGTHTKGAVATTVVDTSAAFHVYAVDWEESLIRWYFDGTEVFRAATPADMHTPMYLLINLGVGGYWPGSPDASTHFPAVLAIDWVRVYKRADSTAPGVPNGDARDR